MPVRHIRELRDRFEAIGMRSNLASALAHQVSQWVQDSGPEWTVTRLKLLKTGFLRRIAGESYTLPYVATRKDALGPVPKGPFGVLWNSTSVSDMTSISRALNAMMVYSTLIAENVTPKQWEKFHTSMCRPVPADSHVNEVLTLLRVPHGMRVDTRVELDTVEEFVVRKGYTPAYVSKAIDHFVESDTGMALWEEFPQYKQSFNSLSGPVDSRIGWDDMFAYHPKLNSQTTTAPVGRLGVTQEPGYKLRVYADPNIAHQIAMSRLKKQLFTLLRRVKWDCTYDQSIGTDWCREQLASGREVWSVDLSDATNNFPLSIQQEVLREIGCLPEDVELFYRLSRAPWSNPCGFTGTSRWTVGQPLGLGPSFAAFALAHGVLVYSIAREQGVSDPVNCFRVLGDDIVISDGQVASRYLEVMQMLGVPISRDKTIRSAHFAEFAGKLVARGGTLAGLKWRRPSDRSFLDVVRLLGPRSLSLLRERQRAVATFVSVLPEPHGFGWNPWGIPFQDRLALASALEELTSEQEVTYHDLQRRWNRVFARLEQPYFRLVLPGLTTWGEPATARAAGSSVAVPRPGGPERHLLSIVEMTGSPLKMASTAVTPNLQRELKRMGYVPLTSSTDPRGLSPLEDLEKKIAQLRLKPEFAGLIDRLSR